MNFCSCLNDASTVRCSGGYFNFFSLTVDVCNTMNYGGQIEQDEVAKGCGTRVRDEG